MTRFSAVDAVRSCMMGPMLQVARRDVHLGPTELNGTKAKAHTAYLESDHLL